MRVAFFGSANVEPVSLLRRSFSNVGFGTFQNIVPGRTLHTCAVPGLFSSGYPYGRLFSKVQRAFRDSSVQLILNPIQGHGLSQESSAAHLLAQLVLHSAHTGLYHYKPKEGQADDVMVIGKPYWTVHSHQREHDHESRRLIDFEFLDFNPFELTFEASSFEDGYHMHLLDDSVSPTA